MLRRHLIRYHSVVFFAMTSPARDEIPVAMGAVDGGVLGYKHVMSVVGLTVESAPRVLLLLVPRSSNLTD